MSVEIVPFLAEVETPNKLPVASVNSKIHTPPPTSPNERIE